ncbi:signal peptide peptidase SppA [Pseudanabaena sp. PCC 6802]|uniref:signal peptide peptidase SppA n=1 Tax=Pseudanabaena sp. PCC 6802 TaxID=118173 RepID=UPI000346CD9C|nr:signal peptide peptidase SppA [Pseudanabaena sp. PCC 6802]
MQLNRIIALVLVAVCFVATAFGIQRRQADEAFSLKSIEKGRDRLELISIDGAITGARTGLNSAIAVRNRLMEIEDVSGIKGVLLTINSPGGTVGASKEVYEAVKKLTEKKPVVVSMLDQATSGGYYIASAANKIYANAGTLTGSIGVILSGLNVKELFTRIGVEPQTIKTGPYKDIFSPFRPISDPEKELLQGLLTSTYEEFVADVAKGRKMDVAAVRKLADGRIYTGTQAKENGLVDAIGTYDDAVADLRKQVRAKFNLPESTDLPIERGSSSFERFLDQLFSGASTNLQLASPLNSLIDAVAPRLLKNSSTGLSSDDPPILLLPSWYTS